MQFDFVDVFIVSQLKFGIGMPTFTSPCLRINTYLINILAATKP